MLDNKKIYIFDKYGINSFLERSYNFERLEVIKEVVEKIIDKIKHERALLIFANDKESKEFKVGKLFTKDLENRVFYIDDFPDLLSIGFEKYFIYDDINSVPGVAILGDKKSIKLDKVVFITSDDNLEEKKFISLEGSIMGNNIFLKNGKLKVMVGQNSKLIFGKNCRIGKDVNITLEKNCCAMFGDGCCFCDGTSISLRSSSQIKIGNNCTFGRVSIDAFCEINIGDNCVMARDVSLRDGDGHDIIGLNSPNYPKRIIIGNNVWLGSRVSILKGVELLEYCIVGSDSVVSKSFPSHTLIAGVPAKIIETGVSWRPDYSFYREIKNVAPTHNWPFI